MTEFEVLALKKIIKDFLIDNVYFKINHLASEYGISNAEISKRVGWDSAGFNQKFNRSNDLRITTFVKIYAAICEAVREREAEYGFYDLDLGNIGIDELLTQKEIDIGMLFNHISAVAEGRSEFLCTSTLTDTYVSMKSFVLLGRKNRKFNEREIGVYIDYYKRVKQSEEKE